MSKPEGWSKFLYSPFAHPRAERRSRLSRTAHAGPGRAGKLNLLARLLDGTAATG